MRVTATFAMRGPVMALFVAASLAGCSGSGNSSAKASATPISAPSTAGASPQPSALPQQSAVSAEKNPPGDIPDNLAFVPYSNAVGKYAFTHPEGWAQTGRGATVLFTDKLNGVQVQPGTATAPPSAQSARAEDVPSLKRSQAAFELRSIKVVSVPGGTGVVIVYRRNSAPDAVTGRQYRDEVERYELVRSGREVVMELYGPVGADNVDAYRTMLQSLRLR